MPYELIGDDDCEVSARLLKVLKHFGVLEACWDGIIEYVERGTGAEFWDNLLEEK